MMSSRRHSRRIANRGLDCSERWLPLPVYNSPNESNALNPFAEFGRVSDGFTVYSSFHQSFTHPMAIRPNRCVHIAFESTAARALGACSQFIV